MSRGRQKNGGKRDGEDWRKQMDGMTEGEERREEGKRRGMTAEGGWKQMQVDERGKTDKISPVSLNHYSRDQTGFEPLPSNVKSKAVPLAQSC